MTYHPSGSWSTIPHTNGTSDAHVVQTNNNSRTHSLYTLNPGNLWNTGTYNYDGSGNIITIGDTSAQKDIYHYDKVNRLARAWVRDAAAASTRQDYTYDVFGNMTEVKTWPVGGGTQTTTIAVNANTNRLSVASYDASGNMTSWGANGYEYDTGNNMVNQDDRWLFLYNFSGERVATIDWQGSIATREVDWTIRGPSNQVLSTFKLTGEDQSGNWSHEMDYIWMGRRLLGTQDGSGTKQHYHTDHLGSVRLVTDSLGAKVSEHEYLPYGQELTAAGNGIMKFTGHERDSDTGMDYMHARYYTGHLGRMMSVDPVQRGDGVWNMYSYVGGNPIRAIDPDGRKLWAWFKGLFGGGADSNVSSQTHGSSGPGFWGRVKRAFGGGSKKSDGGVHCPTCEGNFSDSVTVTTTDPGKKNTTPPEDSLPAISLAAGWLPPWTVDNATNRNIDELQPCIQLSAAKMVREVQGSLGGSGTARIGALDGRRTNRQQNGISSSRTNATGGQSYHNYGLAFDISIIERGVVVGDTAQYAPYGPYGESLGLEWGGRWTKPYDPKHYQIKLKHWSALRSMNQAEVDALPCP